jgi:YD repeat-containing protein
MTKSTSIFVALVLVAVSLGSRAVAQDHSVFRCPLPKFRPGCQAYRWNWNQLYPGNPLPVGTVCCSDGVPFDEQCVAPSKDNCLNLNTPQDICPSCTTAGHPINLATGNTYIIESDISIPGLGGGLSLSRTWNSLLPSIQNSYPFMFGINWRSNYEEQLVLNSSDELLKYVRGDGSVWSFGIKSLGPNIYQVVAPGNDTSTITEGPTFWTLTSKNGEQRLFDNSTLKLISIIDRNGNTTQLSYDAMNRLVTVTDPASRHLNFSYNSSSSNLVNAVTSDTGISFSYAYDAQGRLTQVTKADNTTLSFVYDANNLITSVKDSEGKTLESHTYDVTGRGLTSSRASGVDAVWVSYPQ